MSERIGNAELLPKQVNELPELVHRHPMRTAVLPQEASLDELGPRDGGGHPEASSGSLACRSCINSTAVEPIVQRRLRHPKQPGRFSLGEHLTLERAAQGRHGASVARLLNRRTSMPPDTYSGAGLLGAVALLGSGRSAGHKMISRCLAMSLKRPGHPHASGVQRQAVVVARGDGGHPRQAADCIGVQARRAAVAELASSIVSPGPDGAVACAAPGCGGRRRRWRSRPSARQPGSAYTFRLPAPPSPSWPCPLRPHAQTVPSVLAAPGCGSARGDGGHAGQPADLHRASESVVVPLPSWPGCWSPSPDRAVGAQRQVWSPAAMAVTPQAADQHRLRSRRRAVAELT